MYCWNVPTAAKYPLPPNVTCSAKRNSLRYLDLQIKDLPCEPIGSFNKLIPKNLLPLG